MTYWKDDDNIVSSVPAAPPDFVQCDPISPSSVSISWKPPPLEMSYGIILGYHITYRLENKIGGELGKLIASNIHDTELCPT